jgi:hypothetical protein
VVLEMSVTGLCLESAWLFSVLEVVEVVLESPRDRLLVESLLQKAWPPASCASGSRPSSVVVEILLESGRSFMWPSLSSSSLSSSLSQKSVVREEEDRAS